MDPEELRIGRAAYKLYSNFLLCGGLVPLTLAWFNGHRYSSGLFNVQISKSHPRYIYIYIYIYIYNIYLFLFIYLWLCWVFVAVCGLLIAVAFLVVEHRL